MRLLALGLAALLAGCAAPVVLREPRTGQVVDCTAEAERLAALPAVLEGKGTDVPPAGALSPEMRRFDLERQCAGNLLRSGFVCVSGC